MKNVQPVPKMVFKSLPLLWWVLTLFVLTISKCRQMLPTATVRMSRKKSSFWTIQETERNACTPVYPGIVCRGRETLHGLFHSESWEKKQKPVTLTPLGKSAQIQTRVLSTSTSLPSILVLQSPSEQHLAFWSPFDSANVSLIWVDRGIYLE